MRRLGPGDWGAAVLRPYRCVGLGAICIEGLDENSARVGCGIVDGGNGWGGAGELGGQLFLGKQHIVVSIYTLKGSSAVGTEQAEERIGRLAWVAYEYFEDLGRK